MKRFFANLIYANSILVFCLVLAFSIGCSDKTPIEKTTRNTTKQGSMTPESQQVDSDRPNSVTSPKGAGKTKVTFNVLEHGLKNDGRTDNTAALQQLINNKVKRGNAIFFPSGTYMFDDAVFLQQKNMEMYGEGKKSILKFSNKKDLYTAYKRRAGFINLYADSIKISHLQFDQNFRGSGRKDGEAAMATSLQGGGAFTDKKKDLNNIVVDSCFFYDYYGDAFSFFNAGCTNVSVINSEFVSTFIVQNWKSHHVEGEQAINFSWATNCNIKNNKIKGALDDAIAIHNRSENVVISGNNITTTGGRILMNGTKNGLIENNTIEVIDTASSAIIITFVFDRKSAVMNEGVIIRNNKITVSNNAVLYMGIRLAGCGNNITVENNVIEFNQNPGIGIELSDRRHKVTGAYISGGNVSVKNNTIRNASIGIQETALKTQYTNVRLINNRIYNSSLGINARKTFISDDNLFVGTKKETDFIPFSERPKEVRPRKKAKEDQD